MDEKRKRRWYMFSIRDLAWLTLLCGLLIAWWMDRSRLQREAYNADNIRRLATAQANVAKAELDMAVETNRKAPGTIPETELERLARRYAEVRPLADMSERVPP